MAANESSATAKVTANEDTDQSLSWLNSKRAEILDKKIDTKVLIQSLVTDRGLKRKYYQCKNKYLTLQDIPSWRQQMKKRNQDSASNDDIEMDEAKGTNKSYSCDLSDLFSIYRCDITTLEVDCIVNAANEGLLGGGGVDEAIHKAAGPLLQFECANLPLCNPGHSVITKGYLLPALWVIHTVGPYLDEQNQPQPNVLKQCYESIMELCVHYHLHSIAIPPISTGFYGFPKDEAASIAIQTVIDFVMQNEEKLSHLERVVFTDISNSGVDCYRQAMVTYLQSK